MALNLGQLITGGAAFAKGQREAEQAERFARQQQLLIEVQNRAELARLNEMRSTQNVGAYGMAPSAAQFDLGLREVVAPPAAAPAAATTPAAAPAAAPTGETTYEGMYERLKPSLSSWSMSRIQGLVGAVPEETEKTLALLRNPKNFSTEEIARIYAIALNKEDANTANFLRDVLLNRGISDAELRNIQTQTRAGVTAVRAAETKEAARKREVERLARLRGEKPPAPAAAAPAAPTTGARGIRNNNPGNIRPSDDKWQGMTGVDKAGGGKGYITFDTPENGIRAMTKNLMTYQGRGLDTVEKIINTWAPAADKNDVEAYIRNVTNRLGVARDSKLNLSNPNVMKALVTSIIQHENGAMPYTDQVLNAGIGAGLGTEPTMVAAAAPPAAAPAAPTAPAAAAPTAPTAGVGATRGQLKASDVYVANPQAITYDMQIALQQREDLRRMANNYRNAGMMNEFNQLRAQLYQVDTNLLSLAGLQAVYQFGRTGDPRMLSAALSQKYGESIGFRPRSDGKYDLIANPNMENEKVLREAINGGDIVEEAKLEFDPATRAARADIAMFAAKEEIKGRAGKETAFIKAVADIQAAIIKGEADKAVELAKQNKLDLKQDATSGLWAVIKGNEVRIINPAEAQETIETPLGAIPRTPTARRVLGLNFGQ